MTNLEKKQSKSANIILQRKLKQSWNNGRKPVMYVTISQAYGIPYKLVCAAGPRAKKVSSFPILRIKEKKLTDNSGNYKRIIGLKPVDREDKEELDLFLQDQQYFIDQWRGMAEVFDYAYTKAYEAGLITKKKLNQLRMLSK